MNLTFSAHALDRCFERRISLQGVLDALRQGTCVKGSGMNGGSGSGVFVWRSKRGG